jgi:hypothetical protein
MGVQLQYQPFDAAVLLEGPTSTQRAVLEYMASPFLENAGRWPVFDYVEGAF